MVLNFCVIYRFHHTLLNIIYIIKHLDNEQLPITNVSIRCAEIVLLARCRNQSVVGHC